MPTRDRPLTVVSTVSSILRQDERDLELLVHDNSTTDETAQRLQAFDDPRLRYVRVTEPLAMTGNWEAALQSVDAAWVTVVGDDDALLPRAIEHLRQVLDSCRDLGVRAVSWQKAKYSWPQRTFDANKLKVLARGRTGLVSSRSVLDSVLDRSRRYEQLPMLYNAFIAMDVLDGIRGRAGRFVGSQSPDVYSGTAVAIHLDRFLQLGVPLSVNGLSSSSNGVNAIARRDNPSAADWRARNSAAGLELHPLLPQVRGLSMAVYDSVLRAADDLSVDLSAHHAGMLVQVMQDARAFSEDEAEAFRLEFLAAAERTERRSVIRRVRRYLQRNPVTPIPEPEVSFDRVRPRLANEALRVDSRVFGVTDVAQAAEVVGRFYDWEEPVEVDAEVQQTPGRGRRIAIRGVDSARRRLLG